MDCQGSVTALPLSNPTTVNLIQDWGVVYNNPVQNSLRLDVNTNVNYSIFDLTGSVVNSGVLNGGVSNVNIANLSSGTYVVQLTNNHEVLTFKIVKN